MIYKFFEIRNKIPKFLIKLIPKLIRKKINKRFFNFNFIPTSHLELPSTNYVNRNNLDYQKNLITEFNHNSKQNSSTTCPYLLQLLLMKFKTNDEIVFLDVGADNIDLYLELNKNFKNLKYFFHNLKSVNDIFEKLKLDNNYENLFIIDQINDDFNQKFDFVNFGSSIQYFNNYEFILEKITNLGKIIMFSGTTLYETKNEKYIKHMVVKQVNMFPDINYLYLFNKQNFYQIFFNKNFKLLFEKENLTDNIDYTNFNKIFDNISYMDFLFIKNDLNT